MRGEAVRAQPKPRPKLLEKYKAESERDKTDRRERAACKARSGGRCEVITRHKTAGGYYATLRCKQRASENHHLISGIGRRNRGWSILAAHRLDTCGVCHREITNHVLVPCVPEADRELAAKVRYERKR